MVLDFENNTVKNCTYTCVQNPAVFSDFLWAIYQAYSFQCPQTHREI